MIKTTLTHIRSFMILSLLIASSIQTYAQNEDVTSPFHQYFLWYTGTIDDAPIHAKVAVHNNTYEIYYAYDDKKEWIHLINPTVTNATVTAEVALDGKGSKGFMELKMDDLHNISGVLKPATGEEKNINLKVSLKELPESITNATVKNELTPLLLNANEVIDTIGIYHGVEVKPDDYFRYEISAPLAFEYPDYPTIYIDVNFDGYLDIYSSGEIYFFKPEKQRFVIEKNRPMSHRPGFSSLVSYDTYARTIKSSFWDQMIWYKVYDDEIKYYETEEYFEHSEEVRLKTNIKAAQNRYRYYNYGTSQQKNVCVKLDLHLDKATTLTPKGIVAKFIGNSKINILEDAQLILRFDTSKTRYYYHTNSDWELIYTEINGVKN